MSGSQYLGRFVWLLMFLPSLASARSVHSVRVVGNGRVEEQAILAVMAIRPGTSVASETLATDVRALFDLGYFSSVHIFETDRSDGSVDLLVQVREKLSVARIVFYGLEELKEKELIEQMRTKVYAMVNESYLAEDARLIEKKYHDRGFFLAQVVTQVEPISESEAEVRFEVGKLSQILVGDVHFEGHQAFSRKTLLEGMLLRPLTRWSNTFERKAFFLDEYASRDAEYLAYFYRNAGYAKVQVSPPNVRMDPDRRMVDVYYRIKEGKAYRVSRVGFVGDVGPQTYREAQLLEATRLAPDALFRHQDFIRDVETLVDRYGDLGYAYVDVQPDLTYDDEAATVALEYRVTQGPKVYFGNVEITGNTKTRDNVIRREFDRKLADAGLYSGTAMSESKTRVSRLGFFETVKVTKRRNKQDDQRLDVEVEVKEKLTGSANFALSYTPPGGSASSGGVTGKLAYKEDNQSGYGWANELSFSYGDAGNWQGSFGFSNSKVNDSRWSLGVNASYQARETRYSSGLMVPEVVQKLGTRVGREIWDHTFLSWGIEHSEVFEQGERIDAYVVKNAHRSGVKNSLSQTLVYRRFDNELEPTEGNEISYSHRFFGGVLQGDYNYHESVVQAKQYWSWNLSESYRTTFRLLGNLSKLWLGDDTVIAFADRYRLGYYDLRGFPHDKVGPKGVRTYGPDSPFVEVDLGGDKQVYAQLEYVLPIIAEANLNGVLFFDIGKVFGEDESLSLNLGAYSKDVGFGLRWKTPMGPFRFEWAYPYNPVTQALGERQFILSLGI